MRRKTMPFVSTDRYDPRQVFEYPGYVLKLSLKNFHATQTSILFLKIALLESDLVKNRSLNHSEDQKNVQNRS